MKTNKALKIKLFIGLLALMLFGAVFAACNKEKTTIKLDAPDTFSVTGTILEWQAVSNANGYMVRIGDNDYFAEQNNFDLSIMPSGIYRVQVRAKHYETSTHNYQQSDFGELLYIRKLNASQSISFGYNVLNWSAVSGANGYVVNVYENQTVIYTTTTNSTSIPFSNFSNLLTATKNYSATVEVVASTASNTIQDGIMVFATINSNYNSMNFEVSNKLKTPNLISLSSERNRIEWQGVDSASGYNLLIKNSLNETIYTGVGAYNSSSYSWGIAVSEFENILINSGTYKVCVQAIAPAEPLWILENYKAIFASENSDFGEYTLSVDLDTKFATTSNIRFYQQTFNYYTGLQWNTVIGANKYQIDLYNPNNELVYTQFANNTIIGLKSLFSTHYELNEITHKFTMSGQYIFKIRAVTQDKEALNVYNNQIVKFTQNGNFIDFAFTVNANGQVSKAENFAIRNRYVGGEITWFLPTSNGMVAPDGYIVTIENSNGDVIDYGHHGRNSSYGSYPNDVSDYILINEFIHRLTESGNYTICIIALRSPDIYSNSLTKPQNSEAARFTFYFNKDTNKISQAS